MKKIRPFKLKNNTAKKARNNNLILGILSVAVIVAFIGRTFYDQIAPMLNVDAGQFRTYCDHVLGFGVAAILIFFGFVLVGNPILGMAIGGAGLVVAYLSYLKLTNKE